jgi:hypothetical protein
MRQLLKDLGGPELVALALIMAMLAVWAAILSH